MTAGGILTAAGRVIPGDACKHHERDKRHTCRQITLTPDNADAHAAMTDCRRISRKPHITTLRLCQDFLMKQENRKRKQHRKGKEHLQSTGKGMLFDRKTIRLPAEKDTFTA